VWFPRLLLSLACLPFGTAAADIVDDLNQVRLTGCEGRAGAPAPLQHTKAMNEVAREWSRGGRLRDAAERTGTRLQASSSMHVDGGKNDAAIVNALIANFCQEIVDPLYTQIGVHRAKDRAWVVVAKLATAPNPGNASEVSARPLALVNATRAKAHKCGNVAYPAAPPLALSPLLERAALAHAQDMAEHDSFEHIGSDGSRPATRVARTGYQWRNVAENIAAGAPDVESVVQGWIESPGHCANLMDRRFTEMGIAFVVNEQRDAEIYWAQVFGTPR
jgi:uncharacterized protein YkwD